MLITMELRIFAICNRMDGVLMMVWLAYLVQHSWTIDIEWLTDNLDYLNKYHVEFVNKTGDEYTLPVVDLDRLRKTAHAKS